MDDAKIIISEEMSSSYDSQIESLDLDLVDELYVNKIRQLGRENFLWHDSGTFDYYKLLKESSKFFNFKLPSQFDKIFISYKNAYVYWIYKSPLMEYVEDFFRVNLLKGGMFDRYKHLKEFFLKWVALSSKEDKKFYASSAITYIEKDLSKKNFLNQVIQAVILIYENSLHDPDKALSLLENAQKTIESVKIDDLYKEELIYLIRLHKGFLKLRENKPLSAINDFQDAAAIYPDSVTPKFHMAISNIKAGNYGDASQNFFDVVQNDLDRLGWAILTNKFAVFNYFLEHNTTQNIFSYPQEFSNLFDTIEGFVDENKGKGAIVVNHLRDRIQRFKELKMNSFYKDDIINNLAFLDKIAYGFNSVSDAIFCAVAPKLEEKFEKTVGLLGDSIKGFHFSEVESSLKIFETGLQDQGRYIERIKIELEEFKAKLQKKLNITIENYQQNISEHIGFFENRIENLHMVSSLDPKVSLKNNLNYNLILAIMIFLIGGFASYTSSSVTDISEFKSLISTVVATGLKWGSVSFFLGLIISFFIAGSVVLERSSQKQRLMQKITQLKNEKERVIEQLREEAKEREKSHADNLGKRMEIHKGRITELKKEFDQRQVELREEAHKKIQTEFDKLNELISVPLKIS